MTVRELIAHLSGFDLDAQIVLSTYGCGNVFQEPLLESGILLGRDINYKGRVRDRPVVVVIDAERN